MPSKKTYTLSLSVGKKKKSVKMTIDHLHEVADWMDGLRNPGCEVATLVREILPEEVVPVTEWTFRVTGTIKGDANRADEVAGMIDKALRGMACKEGESFYVEEHEQWG